MYTSRSLTDVKNAFEIGYITRDNMNQLPEESEVDFVVQHTWQPQYFVYTKNSIYFVYMTATHKWKITALPR